MRRLLAATLVLALATSIPATTYADTTAGDGELQADEPSGGDQGESTTPQPPPRDAVVLTIDADPYEARIDELYEVDWYRFTAVAERDYWIVAETVFPNDVDITVVPHDASGTAVEATTNNRQGDLRWALLTDAVATTYYVRVFAGEYSIDPTGDYAIEVRTIEDDHANAAAAGTAVHPAATTTTEHAGTIDYSEDVDWLVFLARAGDTYGITARYGVRINVFAVDSAGETVGDSLDEWGTSLSYGEMNHKPWHFEESGRYAVSIHDDSYDRDYPYEYTVTFERLTDDHANLPDDPSPLHVGRRTDAALNYDYDEDWFYVDLVEGGKYLVEFLPGESPPARAEVILYGVGSSEYQDAYIRQRHTLSYPGTSRRVWEAGETGRHLVNVRTTEGWRDATYPNDYSITVGRRPADDHADGPEGATPIRSGEWLEATLDVAGDEDWYSFSARPGVVYAVEFLVRLPGQDEFATLPQHYRWRGTLAYFIDDNWGFDADSGYVFGDGGTQYLVFTTDVFGDLENVDYRFKLVEYESVDYGDDRSMAETLLVGETVVGSATDTDADWFIFDAVAGGIYSISSGSGFTSVTVFDDGDEVPSRNAEMSYLGERWSNRGLEYWTSPAAGRYWIRLSGRWAQPFVYRLAMTYTPAAEDDHGDSAEEATDVALAPLQDDRPAAADPQDGSAASATVVGELQARVEGRLENFLDEDWFALRLERGVKYRIIPFAPDPESYQPSEEVNENVDFNFWDGETFLDSYWEWFNPTIGFVPTVSGTYHLSVEPGGSEPFLEPQDYSFEVEILEPDDGPELREAALPLQAGAVLENSHEASGDVDWFRFDALDGQTWILQSATGLRGCVQVYGPGETGPFFEQCERERMVWITPADGEYGLRLTSRLGANRGHRAPFDYRLTLSPADPDDHGNSHRDASTLVAGEEQSGRIDYIGDRDLFRLAVAEGALWELDFSSSVHGVDYQARFVAVGGDPSGVFSRYAMGGILGAPADGAWLISVTGDDSGGDYSLEAEQLDLSDDYGNDRDRAHMLAGPTAPDPGCESGPDGAGCSDTTSVAGTLDFGADSDYFRVSLEVGTKYGISVESESEQVIFALLTEDSCALEGPTVWEKTYDTWVPERTADYWLRVGFRRYRSAEPVDYTLEITAHGDDFLTITERATQLEPNMAREVSGDDSTGRDLYRVSVDHPRYVIEVTGAGFRAGGISPSEQFDSTWWEDGSRYITPLPSNPPLVYFFRVSGPAGSPYTVVVREHVPSDNDLDWNQVHVSPASEPDYCFRAGDEWWR